MAEDEFTELAGRIEGIGRSVLLLIVMMEQQGTINGSRYCASLRKLEKELSFEGAHLQAVKRTMRETAQELDGARKIRRTADDPA